MTKVNNTMLSFAMIMLVASAVLLGCNSIWTPKEDHFYPGFTVQPLFMDVSNEHVLPEYFVASADPSLTFELMVTDEEDPYWKTEDHVFCEDVGNHIYWIRGLGPKGDTAPVPAILTVVDANGACGKPMFNPGPNEEDSE